MKKWLLFFIITGSCSSAGALRFATHNAYQIGVSGTTQYEALADSIDRICPDILVLQEVSDDVSDITNLANLASSTGYSYYRYSGAGVLSGGLRTACMSKYSILSYNSWSAREISSDPDAEDISREILECRISLSGSVTAGVFTVHLKSDSTEADMFRRQVEVIRLCQVIDVYRALHPSDPLFLGGDFNEDYDTGSFGTVWNSVPSGMPVSFNLGSDITFPITYHPFQPLLDRGFTMLYATWEDSTTNNTTRPASGRRIDYLFELAAFPSLGDEVYYSTQDNGIDDEPTGNWLSKCGATLPSGTSLDASDHLPVFADFDFSSNTPTPTPTSGPAPGLLINEIYYDDASTDDASFIELYGPGQSLANVSIVFMDQNCAQTGAIDLSSYTMPVDGYFVVGMTGVSNADRVDDGLGTWMQNGPCDGAKLTFNGSITLDAVQYGASCSPACAEGGAATEPVDLINSLSRYPDHSDSDDNSVDFCETGISPGLANNVCSGMATPTSTYTSAGTPTMTPTRTATSTPTRTPTFTAAPSTLTPTPTSTSGGAPALLINEIYYDDVSTDDASFIEIYGPGQSFSNVSIIFMNQDCVQTGAIDLSSQPMPGDGYFVVGMTGVSNADLIDDSLETWMQNGPCDGAKLTFNGATTLDAVQYGASCIPACAEGGAATEPANFSNALSRYPDHSDSNNNAIDFCEAPISPGLTNSACIGMVSSTPTNTATASPAITPTRTPTVTPSGTPGSTATATPPIVPSISSFGTVLILLLISVLLIVRGFYTKQA